MITCGRKTFHPGKIIAGFLFGSKRLYEFVNNNPIIELHPTDYVNDPFNIAQNDKMVCINSAISGRSDRPGLRQLHRHTAVQRRRRSVGLRPRRGSLKGGHAVHRLPVDGQERHVTASCRCGAWMSGVVTTRNDVHYVATEYGVAALRGKTIRERAQALIRIAHPNFREKLTQAGEGVGVSVVHSGQVESGDRRSEVQSR